MKSEGNVVDRINSTLRTSITVKLVWIGILILILLIPAAMIQSLIYERQARSQAAIQEVSSKWGNAQTIGGPILSIPVRVIHRDARGVAAGHHLEYVHFLPQTLDITGEVKPEIRSRGIYQAILYNAPLEIRSVFAKPDMSAETGADREILWQDAFVSLGIPDMRGIKNMSLEWDGKDRLFNPGIPTQDIFAAGLSAPVPVSSEASGTMRASIKLNLNGSGRVAFLPMGKTTSVKLTSPWTAPSFVGEFLPENREVTDTGFSASWNVLHFNRPYPQQWRGKVHDVARPDFGVELFQTVDHYQKTTRSAKYAVLFLFLTFAVFFFAEIFGRHPLHTIQYLLVGFALCLFYLLLLSLSEHVSFWAAYAIASATIVGMITGYSNGVFGRKLFTGVIGGTMLALYGFLYSLLQMEDYALLFGTLFLTVVLAALMYVTRKSDWFRLQDTGAAD